MLNLLALSQDFYGRISLFLETVIIGLVIAFVGLNIARIMAKISPRDAYLGKFILFWMLLGYSVGGAIGVVVGSPRAVIPGEDSVAIGGFGLLFGWVIGIVHGSLALWIKDIKASGEIKKDQEEEG